MPVGNVHLIIEGATVQKPGLWSDLEFELVTIAGRDNAVDRPIYLLTLDVDSGRLAGGDEEVELNLAGIPGAVMKIKPHSVFGPDGKPLLTKVLWTQVNLERVPMPPPLGSQFMLAWTVMPHGLHFDPPAQICIPNMAMPAGQVTEVFNFDHDVGEFVAVGTATVSEDGKVMCSDPGFGVTKSGWGGCVPPPPPCTGVCSGPPPDGDCYTWQAIPPTGSCTCPTYKKVDKNGACDDMDKCTENDKCVNGACKGEPVEITKVEAKVEGKDEWVTCPDREVAFSVPTIDAKHCTDFEYEWKFGDGNTSTTATVHLKFGR